MSIGTTILFLLACAGATTIAAKGRIFNRIRPAGKFWRCGLCLGFHIGWMMAMICGLVGVNILPFNPTNINHPHIVEIFSYALVNLFVCACASSAVSYLVVVLVNDDGLKINSTKE